MLLSLLLLIYSRYLAVRRKQAASFPLSTWNSYLKSSVCDHKVQVPNTGYLLPAAQEAQPATMHLNSRLMAFLTGNTSNLFPTMNDLVVNQDRLADEAQAQALEDVELAANNMRAQEEDKKA